MCRMCRTLRYNVRYILKTWFLSIFSNVNYFFPKNSKITIFAVYFEIVIPIDGDPDGKILSSSRLESIGFRSNHFKAIHSRSISPCVLEYKWLIEKLCTKKRYMKMNKFVCSMELFICRRMHKTVNDSCIGKLFNFLIWKIPYFLFSCIVFLCACSRFDANATITHTYIQFLLISRS